MGGEDRRSPFRACSSARFASGRRSRDGLVLCVFQQRAEIEPPQPLALGAPGQVPRVHRAAAGRWRYCISDKKASETSAVVPNSRHRRRARRWRIREAAACCVPTSPSLSHGTRLGRRSDQPVIPGGTLDHDDQADSCAHPSRRLRERDPRRRPADIWRGCVRCKPDHQPSCSSRSPTASSWKSGPTAGCAAARVSSATVEARKYSERLAARLARPRLRIAARRSMTRRRSQPLVLLAEDFEDARELYRDYLEFSGFTVETATQRPRSDRSGAWRCMPDIILMDASMPVLDGWQATRALKADPSDQAHPDPGPHRARLRRCAAGGEGRGLRRLRHQAVPARRPGHPDPRRPRFRDEKEALDERPGLSPSCCKLPAK